MSSIPIPLSEPVSRTIRQFQMALAAALAIVCLGVLIYCFEKYLLGLERRFVENPSDVTMRAFGLAHFLLGWLFLLTSPKIRTPYTVARLIGLAVVGGLVCWFYAAFGSLRNPYLVMAFYGYFLVHEVRDQAHMFRTSGEMPSSGDRVLPILTAFAVTGLATSLVSALLMYTTTYHKPTPLDLASSAVLLALTLLLALATLSLGTWLIVVGRRLHGGVREFLAAYYPLLNVYGIILLVLLAGSMLGSTGFNLVILIHISSWLVFVPSRLAGAERRQRTWWTWLRGTPAGFLATHLVLAALILVCMAIRVHVWQRVGWVSVALANSSFVYWGLMHITTSFWSIGRR